MSLIKAIRQQLGLSVTPGNNFTLDASADNGTMKLARGNAGATTQDIMTVDAAGKVGFSVGVLGFAFGGVSNRGYLKLPSWMGGWQIEWGTTTLSTPAANTWASGDITTLSPFVDDTFVCLATARNAPLLSGQSFSFSCYPVSANTASIAALTSIGAVSNIGINFLFIGKGA